MSYTSDFILLIKWIDPRLVFYNLRDQYDMNALSKSIQGKIWAPALSFPNARQAEGTVVDELNSCLSNTFWVIALSPPPPMEDLTPVLAAGLMGPEPVVVVVVVVATGSAIIRGPCSVLVVNGPAVVVGPPGFMPPSGMGRLCEMILVGLPPPMWVTAAAAEAAWKEDVAAARG